jgi:hypothetical protein
MSKLYNEAIDVSQDQDGGPRSFIWRKKVYQVTSYTVERDPESTSRFKIKRYQQPDRYRCETKQGLVCELVKGERWILERIWD